MILFLAHFLRSKAFSLQCWAIIRFRPFYALKTHLCKVFDILRKSSRF